MNGKNNTHLILSLILIIVTLFSLLTIYAYSSTDAASPRISAKAAALYEPETESFLYSKNENARLPMASTTKIMTAAVALEECELDEAVKIDERAIGVEGSSAYLKCGDVLTMEELLYALMLQSANDAAAAIAYHISGSIEEFADLMNERCDALGLSDTSFKNPHGLDDPEHYTTAHDLAKIAAFALRNEKFRQIVSTYKKTFATEERRRTYVNHNKLLNLYDGCVGVKTGFTKKSGRCLVGAAERDGLTFISVTLDAPSDWQDHTNMLDYGYATLEKITFAEQNGITYELPLLEGTADTLTVKNATGADIIIERGDHEIKEYIKLPRFAVAPVRDGERLGEIIYTVDGKPMARVDLVATESVPVKEGKGFFSKIFSIFR